MQVSLRRGVSSEHWLTQRVSVKHQFLDREIKAKLCGFQMSKTTASPLHLFRGQEVALGLRCRGLGGKMEKKLTVTHLLQLLPIQAARAA